MGPFRFSPVRIRRSVAAFAVIGLTALPACGGGDGDKTEQGQEAVTTTAPAETTTTTAAGPDQSPKELALGTPVAAGNFSVTFHAVTLPYQVPEDRIFKPIPGTLLATIDTEVTNNGTAVEEFQANMVALDVTNRIFPLVGGSGIQPEAPRGQIAPGTSKRGLHVIQLLDGAQAPGLRLVFLPDEDKEPGYVLPLVAGGTPPAAPSAPVGDPAKVYAKGEAAQLNWGVIVVHGVTNPAPPDDPKWDAPDAGFHLVVADVEVFNISKQHQDAYDFRVKIKDSANQEFQTTSKNTAADKIADRGLDGKIVAGLGFRGPVTFMVPDATGSGPLTLMVQFKGDAPLMFALA